jgi:hypothetical protein
MSNSQRYTADFEVKGAHLIQLEDEDVDKLIARATLLLESSFKTATCTVKDSKNNTVIQVQERRSVE